MQKSTFFQRIRTTKGYGVHSPFAFFFITKVINEKLPYNAYFDISHHLSKNAMDSKEITEIHHLLFRLVNFFQPQNILEIGLDKGISMLFLIAPSQKITCVGIEKDPEKIAMAQKLLSYKKKQIEIRNTIPNSTFDAIFCDLDVETTKNENIEEILFEHSHNQTFWMITNKGRSKAAKATWERIKSDERARITFDKKQVGIVILNSDYHKLNYLI